MAQVFIPEGDREREQLQNSVNAPEFNRQPPRQEDTAETPRRVGLVDLIIALIIIAITTLIVVAASHWTAPLQTTFTIDLSLRALPVYAGFSLLRMFLAYILSLVFSLTYGHIAAVNPRARTIMVPILDILQSIPILSFLPAVVLALVAAFPHSNIGLELSSVILIFTSQAWNMTFSFYHSARTLPPELKEFSSVARLRPWQRFLKLEVPASMIGLIWNSMMSWAGGWFFLMAAEQFSLGSKSFQLPGLGSYLQTAVNQGDVPALVCGLATLVALIILLDFFFWRPLVAWADKFKIEMSSGDDTPESFVLNAIRRSALIHQLQRTVFRPIGAGLARILNRLQPLPKAAQAPRIKGSPQKMTVGRIIRFILALVICAGILYGLYSTVTLLAGVSPASWGTLVLAAGATLLRTWSALLIGIAWTVPVGVAIGFSPRWSQRMQPIVQVMASIPATAFFPLLLVFFVRLPAGVSIAAVVLMLLGTQWYILFNVIAGAMAIPSDLKEATTIYQLSRWQRWRTLILPAIFPYLVTGLITASGGAWNASIVSEYVQYSGHTVHTFGLGASIAAAGATGHYADLLAGTLLMAAVVILLNRLVWRRMYALAERRFTLG
ncbi:ABC transporter permease [Ktedonobacteria bacterium brp13]|nr:ABC transporter permease [Ktedonobacteria bacterium brp13]